MRRKNKHRQRKQDKRSQRRILTDQGFWDPVGAINRINELADQLHKKRRL